MFPLIATLFLAIPIIDIYLLIQVGQVIGAGLTIMLVVLTAVIGVWLLRIQGLSTLIRVQQKFPENDLTAPQIILGKRQPGINGIHSRCARLSNAANQQLGPFRRRSACPACHTENASPS